MATGTISDVDPQASEGRYAMVDKTGWDPYQVWLTRIRPQQRLIESGREETDALERSGHRLFAFGGVSALVRASGIIRDVRILLRIQFNDDVDKQGAGLSKARRHSSLASPT